MVGYLNVALVALAAIAPAAAAPFNPNPVGRRSVLFGEAGREIVARALQVDPALIQALGGHETRNESLVTRCVCPAPTTEERNPPPCGCAGSTDDVAVQDLTPAGTTLSSIINGRQLPSDMSSLLNGRRDVAVDPNSIVATGGVPGGGIVSKITQGIGSLLGLRSLDARDEFYEEFVRRCICPTPTKENPVVAACGCALEPSDLLPADVKSFLNERRDVAVDPNSIVATGGVPGGGILSKITQGIGSLLGLRGLDARDEFHEELVSRCTCPSPPKENPIFTCGCAFPSEIQTSAFPADISSLVNGRRDVAVDPNSIVATGGVPGGGILSKITQGIGSLLGL